MATLLSHLEGVLKQSPGSHKYTLQILRSQPRRAHALFPHATDLSTKIWQEEILVVLSEDIEVPAAEPVPTPSTPATEEVSTTVPIAPVSAPTKRAIPILALEANIYTVPTTSTSLVYISKVDSTGLLPPSTSSPTRALVSAFIAYHLANPPHATRRVRIHIFARAQGQYLFPGSVENKGKRVLDDKGLIKWWKKTLEKSVERPTQEAAVAEKEGTETDPKLFYLIPGMAYLDSLPYVPNPVSPSHPKWTYGHPYSSTNSPLYLPLSQPSPLLLPDLIPSFPDDPKSRFMHSLTSSVIAPSGNADDYDDLMGGLTSTYLSSTSASQSKVLEIERERERERKRLTEGIEGGVEEYWERMAFRQECCSGVLVAFFVLALDRPVDLEKDLSSIAKNGAVEPARSSVPYAVFTKLWSQIHNVDYSWSSGPAKMAEKVEKWAKDVEIVVKAEGWHRKGEKDTVHLMETEVATRLEVENKEESKKREAEETKAPVVNMMVPRKKKKVAA